MIPVVLVISSLNDRDFRIVPRRLMPFLDHPRSGVNHAHQARASLSRWASCRTLWHCILTHFGQWVTVLYVRDFCAVWR